MINRLNPLTKLQDKIQTISWKHLDPKTLYKLELVLPFKGTIKDYKGIGAYWRLYARSLKDQKLIHSEMFEKQPILIDIPIKTFERAWLGVSYLFRQQLNEQDNLILHFKKLSKESIEIVYYERVAPTSDDFDCVDEYYNSANSKQQVKVRKVEEI